MRRIEFLHRPAWRRMVTTGARNLSVPLWSGREQCRRLFDREGGAHAELVVHLELVVFWCTMLQMRT
jgi:hypothetical protein